MKITKKTAFKIADFLMMVVALFMLLKGYNQKLEPVYILLGIYAAFSIVRTAREVMNKKSER